MGFPQNRTSPWRRWAGRSATLATAAILLTQTLTAQVDARWFGTWTFNPSKSTGISDEPFKNGTLKIEPLGDSVRITYELFRERGGVTHLEWTGQFDGRDYALEGIDEYSVTNAYRRVDDHTYEIVQRVDGAISTTATITRSQDDKTLTTTTRGRNALGENVTTVSVYQKP